MQNLIISFGVVMPLFIMLALGYGIKSLKMLSDDALLQINNVCFRVFLPLLLFVNIYKTDLNSVFSPKLMLFAIIAVILIFLITSFIICRIEKNNMRRGVLIQAIFRSNFVIFGVPICISLYGESVAGAPSLVAAIIVPMYNALAVIALSAFSGQKFNLKRTVLEIVKNPLIIASAISVILLLSHVKLPHVIVSCAEDLAKVATPLALVILGASFQFSNVKSNLRSIIIGVAGKLIIVPAVALPIAVALGFRGVDLVVCLAMFTAPTAVSSFTMAQQMNADSELAGELVVFSAFFSIITIFGFVFVLKHFMLI